MIKKTKIPTYVCSFVIGANRGYEQKIAFSLEELREAVQVFQANSNKPVPVTICEGYVVLEDYLEKSYKIEMINYPRFFYKNIEIEKFASSLIEYLLLKLEQKRITLITPTEAILFENIT